LSNTSRESVSRINRGYEELTIRTLERQIRCIPDIAVIASHGNNPNPKDKAAKDVEYCPCWNEQWRANIGNLAPWYLLVKYVGRLGQGVTYNQE
jgi:hypothetical protein